MSYSSINFRPTISRNDASLDSIWPNRRSTNSVVQFDLLIRCRSRKSDAVFVPLANETPMSAFGEASCNGSSNPNGNAPISIGKVAAQFKMRNHWGSPISTGEILSRKFPSKSLIVSPSSDRRSSVIAVAFSISMSLLHAITGTEFNSDSSSLSSRLSIFNGTS